MKKEDFQTLQVEYNKCKALSKEELAKELAIEKFINNKIQGIQASRADYKDAVSRIKNMYSYVEKITPLMKLRTWWDDKFGKTPMDYIRVGMIEPSISSKKLSLKERIEKFFKHDKLKSGKDILEEVLKEKAKKTDYDIIKQQYINYSANELLNRLVELEMNRDYLLRLLQATENKKELKAMMKG